MKTLYRRLALFVHRLGSPRSFFDIANRLIPWLGWLTAILIAAGLYGGLVLAPPDYQQGDSFRIIYVHVPSVWLSLFVYVVMAAAGAVSLIWRIKLADVVLMSSAPIGASFTFLALITGSLWGKPMWGTWWVWDARLTSVLVLFFLYLGYIALWQAIEEPVRAGRAAAILAIVGFVNVPIIKFSVDWWNTLHQPASVIRAGGPAIAAEMLWPLLLMAVGFTFYYITLLLVRMKSEVLAARSRALRMVAVDTGAG